jgi:hypothetical protein
MVSLRLSNDKSPRSELKDEAARRSPAEPADASTDTLTDTLIVASTRALGQILA